jgi:hypothetical protein
MDDNLSAFRVSLTREILVKQTDMLLNVGKVILINPL